MPPAYEVLLLNTAIPQIQAAQSGDTYVVPRDISFSAGLTLAAGTANGVPYLNGSKVLTSGSALTFNGSNFATTGSATVNKIITTNASSELILDTTASAYPRIGGSTSMGWNAGTQHIWETGGSSSPVERMRLSSDGTFRVKGAGTAGSTDAVQFSGSAPASAMTLDASGNLLVGATSGSERLVVGNGVSSEQIKINAGTGWANLILKAGSSNGGSVLWNNGSADRGEIFYYHVSDYMAFKTAATERARITSGGDLLVGETGTSSGRLHVKSNGATGAYIYTAGSVGGLYIEKDYVSGLYATFKYNNTVTGSIDTTNGTNTNYNTSSDYRLKTLIAPVSGAGARIDALEPVEFEWKVNGKRARGFFAHQFQEVYPDSVSGTKDAVDANGNPVYQSMQASTSEVIADLVAELQSLRARVAQLEQGN